MKRLLITVAYVPEPGGPEFRVVNSDTDYMIASKYFSVGDIVSQLVIVL